MRVTVLLAVLFLLISTVFVSAPFAGAETNNNYVIGEEDIIQMSVWGNSDLNCQVPVKPGGMISLPLLGDIRASGFTVEGLRSELERDYSKFVKNPVVNVLVTAVNSYKVYILDEAMAGKSSGELVLKKKTSLLQLLSETNTLKGDPKNIYVLRDGKKMEIDVASLFKGTIADMALERGDIIYIPQTMDSTIRVTGAVKNPALIPYVGGMTALDAVIGAGGFNEFASQNAVYVIRKAGEKIVKIRARLKDFVNGSGKNVSLEPGDVVNVETSLF